MVATAAFLAIIPAVYGHGGIVSPPARETNVALWFNEGCQVGCEKCKGHVSAVASLDPFIYCFKRDQEPTLNLTSELVTYPGVSDRLSFKYNPWYAPGFAPVFSPCGLAAGQAGGSYPQNGDVPPPGFKPGFDGRNLNRSTTPVVWPVGSIQEVAWSIAANHGGGYAVRLCPIAAEATEDCFQKHHLSFHGDSSWIKLGGSGARIEIKANQLRRVRIQVVRNGQRCPSHLVVACTVVAWDAMRIVLSRSFHPLYQDCGEMVLLTVAQVAIPVLMLTTNLFAGRKWLMRSSTSSRCQIFSLEDMCCLSAGTASRPRRSGANVLTLRSLLLR